MYKYIQIKNIIYIYNDSKYTDIEYFGIFIIKNCEINMYFS